MILHYKLDSLQISIAKGLPGNKEVYYFNFVTHLHGLEEPSTLLTYHTTNENKLWLCDLHVNFTTKHFTRLIKCLQPITPPTATCSILDYPTC